MNPAVQSFLTEAAEILETLDDYLLALEQAPQDADGVAAVFRALHTLKGSGGMFGFARMAGLLHYLEDAFDRVRTGSLAVTPELIGLALEARDTVETLLADGPDGDPTPSLPEAARDLLTRIEAWAGGTVATNVEAPGPTPQATAPTNFEIAFQPDTEAMRNGMRPDLLMEELAELGMAEIRIDASEVPDLNGLDPSICHLCWAVTLHGQIARGAIEDVFIFASDGYLSIEEVTKDLPAPAQDTPPPPDGAPSADAGAVASAPAAPATSQSRARASGAASVRVQSGRLDDLMDQIGELVIVQARLDGIAAASRDKGLEAVAEDVERLVTGLRDSTMSLRMLPVDLVFGKFRRMVRDLSSELGKPVRLEMRGAETEIDKTLIDSLTEPLVHIIRNSIDHGIEDADARDAAGKPPEARIGLQARQSGGEVLISVTDDGGGLDAEAIRTRAVERGLIAEDALMTDAQAHRLIFEPGFSTAKALTSVSGRGVGMDAVRRTIEELGGSVDVTSRRGSGTRVMLRLPVTTAIIDGLLVRVGAAPFVVPMAAVTECVEMPKTPRDVSGRAILRIRDELVPYLTLSREFGFETPEDADPRVVITAVEGQRVGLVVDAVIGQRQAVVKGLSVYHRDVLGLAGSTILGDGSVALILDAAAFVRAARGPEKSAA